MRSTLRQFLVRRVIIRMYSSPGGGAGGGGGAGSIREAGGAFGRLEAAREGQYFHEKSKEQLKELKEHLQSEVMFHEEQIKRHKAAIQRSKKQVSDMETKK